MKTFKNPIRVKGILDQKECADPFIYRFNGFYYLFVTTGGPYIRGYKSRDLLHWHSVDNGVLKKGLVLDYSFDKNHPLAETPYAPEVIYSNGYFYLVSSPSGQGGYIFRSERIDGPYKVISTKYPTDVMDIDGDFFFDASTGLFYVFSAGHNGINFAKLNKDSFVDFEKFGDGKFEEEMTNCKLSGWTEGPYLLRLPCGNYLTYTGAHFLSKNYRIDYSYCPSKKSICNANFNYVSTIAIDTDTSNWNNLGHSCTVLGPDLDSYYLAYHSMDKSGKRYLNLGRLSFAGSQMSVDDLSKGPIVVPEKCFFNSYNGQKFINSSMFRISRFTNGQDFTYEINFSGKDPLIVFGYKDKNNYSFISLPRSNFNNILTIGSMTEGKVSFEKSFNLKFSINTSYLQCLRLSVSHNVLDIYLNNCLLLQDIHLNINFQGHVGYLKGISVGYIGVSNYSRQSSSRYYPQSRRAYATLFDTQKSDISNSNIRVLKGNTPLLKLQSGGRVTYHIFAKSSGFYSFSLRCKKITDFYLRVDGQEHLVERHYSFKELTVIPFIDIPLDCGQHTIELEAKEGFVEFSEMIFYRKPDFDVKSFALTDCSRNKFYRENISKDKSLITTSNNGISNFINKNYLLAREFSIESILSFKDIHDGFIGIDLNTQFKSQTCSDDAMVSSPDNYQGYSVRFFADHVDIVEVNFFHSKIMKTEKFSLRSKSIIAVEKAFSGIKVIVDGKEIISSSIDNKFCSGYVGLISKDVAVNIMKFNTYLA